jgi:hypothetical protein
MCVEGHSHATAIYARECDERHWKRLEAEYPRAKTPLRTLDAQPPLEQAEMFSDGAWGAAGRAFAKTGHFR